jgi:putative endonuclease
VHTFATRFSGTKGEFSSAGSEHLPYKQRVGGSNPSTPTSEMPQFGAFCIIMFYTYILFSEKLGKYYIGSTDNLERRLHEHNSGKTTFTRTGIPWALVYHESYESKPEAYRREVYIKKQKSVKYIKSLLNKFSSAGSGHPD